MKAYQKSVEEVLKASNSTENGISEKQAKQVLEKMDQTN